MSKLTVSGNGYINSELRRAAEAIYKEKGINRFSFDGLPLPESDLSRKKIIVNMSERGWITDKIRTTKGYNTWKLSPACIKKLKETK